MTNYNETQIDLKQSVSKPSRASILVVDDAPFNQVLIKQMLRKVNAEIDLEGDGRSALKKMASKEYDLLITDIQMPNIDGKQLIMELRSQNSGFNRKIPVIAVTAHIFDEEMNDIKQSGADYILSKPIDKQKLLKLVDQYITKT